MRAEDRTGSDRDGASPTPASSLLPPASIVARTDAPLYVARYRARPQAPAEAPPESADVPKYLLRARLRSQAAPPAPVEAPPGGIPVERAAITRSKEIIPPAGHGLLGVGWVDIHLIRHGETQGYSADGGLTPLGDWQAHRRGDDLSKALGDGETVVLLHAPTARARETAEHVRLGLEQGLSRFAKQATVAAPVADPHFRNFQVQLREGQLDPTQAFYTYQRALERYESLATGDRPGWLVELDRFWRLQAGGGDPIHLWLTNPLLYFEPPALVVRRFWQGILNHAGGRNEQPRRLLVATHSGPLRAFAAHALGYDPGEPYNTEEVRVRLRPDQASALVTYRNRTAEVSLVDLPDWGRGGENLREVMLSEAKQPLLPGQDTAPSLRSG